VTFAVVGAGAIGGYLGALLADSGERVSYIARGPNLEAIRARGMRVTLDDGREVAPAGSAAFANCREAGPHDVVLLTVKAHQVAAIAADLELLCHDGTVIVTMQNGIPWWYFHGVGGAFEGTSLESVDPGGAIGKVVDPARIIGSVVYPAASLVSPGVVRVVEGKRFTLGEPNGQITPRLEALSAALTKAGFKAPTTEDIRGEIWLKLWGNLAFNPLSALTRATLEGMCRFPLTRELARNMMKEAETIANALGVTFRVDVDKRIAGAEKVGAHKTSMLQDLEAGKAMEIDALTGAVVELGRLTNIPTPHIDAVYAAVKLLAQSVAR
jgi:2-dehydropantoate 2-reductase